MATPGKGTPDMPMTGVRLGRVPARGLDIGIIGVRTGMVCIGIIVYVGVLVEYWMMIVRRRRMCSETGFVGEQVDRNVVEEVS
jgi:hypothetical protein